ncbi:MAG: FprA family A-type flavoprotein [bacterium]|nr:FprA family A-type flavoprotein [bacterium]
MAVQEVKPRVYFVGARDWDRRLFDALIPLPHGTSYNAYLIKGSEKTALIDSVDPPKSDELMDNLQQLKVETLDYFICNHTEQDHAGALPRVLERYPEAQVICNPKCRALLFTHLAIPNEKCITVEDGETLSLGDKTLEFVYTPWVHWPETMCTFLKEDKILFSSDFFASLFATDNLFVKNEARAVEEAKRYYAETMMLYRPTVRKNIEKIKPLGYQIIAPSHGPLYAKPEIIVEPYTDWASDKVRNVVLLPYVSMHGSTEKMVTFLIDKFIEKGITVKPFNLSETDIGLLAMAMVDAATIIIATPTVLAGPHPAAVYAASMVNATRPPVKFAAVVGSYGWGGKTVEVIKNNFGKANVEFLESVLVKGLPRENDYKLLEQLAEGIAQRHRDL